MQRRNVKCRERLSICFPCLADNKSSGTYKRTEKWERNTFASATMESKKHLTKAPDTDHPLQAHCIIQRHSTFTNSQVLPKSQILTALKISVCPCEHHILWIRSQEKSPPAIKISDFSDLYYRDSELDSGLWASPLHPWGVLESCTLHAGRGHETGLSLAVKGPPQEGASPTWPVG